MVTATIKEAQSEPADKRRIKSFHPLKKEVWKSYEILSVAAYSLFLLVVFLTRADLSDLSLEQYVRPVLSCSFPSDSERDAGGICNDFIAAILSWTLISVDLEDKQNQGKNLTEKSLRKTQMLKREAG